MDANIPVPSASHHRPLTQTFPKRRETQTSEHVFSQTHQFSAGQNILKQAFGCRSPQVLLLECKKCRRAGDVLVNKTGTLPAGRRNAAAGPSKLVRGSAGSVRPAHHACRSGLHISAPSAIVDSLGLDELLEVRQVFLDGKIIDAESGSGFLHQPGGLPVELHRHTRFVLR